MEVWEILVPRFSNSGIEFTVAKHVKWDEEAAKISGGLTIYKPAKGLWQQRKEQMIPVRLIVNRRGDIDNLVKFTARYYKQEVIMAYRISKKIIMYHRNVKGN